ncbi:DUF2752 domain-containing protein [Rhodococcus aetherivorans]|uniref:DUF2752 domain-containing protein n=1 Tax=Rhodococcus aetherivorans TaxID=191292 RepID=UPI001E5D1FC6|nr:DUF2752 domain-containing protein [Rhodococcus aetherivorans]UGQ41490.1 DUF2752 domain-containing protein [Rhodococcus aetherivorans]
MQTLAARLAAPVGVAAVSACVCAAVAWADPTTPGGPIPACPTRVLFGVWCPGCGSSRMLYSLLHLDVPAALRYNALGVLAVLLLGWSFAVWTAGRVRGHRIAQWYQWRWAPQLVLWVVLGWFVVRNLPVAPFNALRV